MPKHVFSLLCLGDSYTVGEGVPLHQSYPYQSVQMLRKQGIAVHAPEIVAQTGWTSYELADYLIHHSFEAQYDFVTLLIGVNNQYRGLAVEDFAEDFEYLIKKAIGFSSGLAKNVLCLSIPDWGVTPFAQGRDTQEISLAIDEYNATASMLAAKYNVAWLDITGKYRQVGGEATMLASDGLHPSGKIYEHWASEVKDFFSARV